MKRSVIINSLFVAVAATAAVGCSADPTGQRSIGSVEEQLVAEVPAAPSTLGVDVWRLLLEADGFRAVGLDVDGEVVSEFKMYRADDGVTIEDLGTGERIRLASDGSMVENTIAADSRTPEALAAFHADVDAFQRENPEIAHACGWEVFKAWMACGLVYPFCIGTAGLGCIAAGSACVAAAGDAYWCLEGY